MRRLGHERFAVVGHDRCAYVATRLARDHPEAVSGVTVLDAVPIGEALGRCDDMADLYGDVLAVWRDWTGDRLEGPDRVRPSQGRRGTRGSRDGAPLDFWRSVEERGGRAEPV
ncbi:alpha/beta fold hydrolase [Streptomyces sp. Ag82_G6-1]|uniref:alpha/beta fold hydrolase n=1 Tax=Streptomyces sp. Ag82_G6-1 TaxID=1938853 RepID=UPI002696E188